MLSSDTCVEGHDEMEAVLDTLKENLSVIDIDVEFTLNCIMDQHASLNVNVVVFTVPVSLESHRYTFPSLRVVMS